MRIWKYLSLFAVIVLLVFISIVFVNFQSPGKSREKERFVVQPKTVSEEKIIGDLIVGGFLRNRTVFYFILNLKGWRGKIEPGGHFLTKRMNAYELAQTLVAGPAEKWVVVPPGKRKEQVALILKQSLGWMDDRVVSFLQSAQEGYLFPDTYLLPVDAKATDIVRIFKTNFERYFDADLQKELLAQNIRSDTAIKIASIIERESGGDEDKPVIAGILWNRLLKGMRLEIDATVQYAWSGQICGLSEEKPPVENCNFWPRIPSGTVRKISSPYNTYLHNGLPPGPISSPSLASIKAVIYPASTKAFYYLHSSDKQIHTAETLKGHLLNIERYL